MFDERSGKERVLWRQQFYHRASRARDVFVTRDGLYLVDIDRSHYSDKYWVVAIYGKDGVRGIPGKTFYIPKNKILKYTEGVTRWLDWNATVELVGPHTLRLDTPDGRTRLVDLVSRNIKIIDRPPLKAFRSDF